MNPDVSEFAKAKGSDTTHATTWGLLATAALIGGIFIGSRGMRDFDPALVSYAGATLFAAFGLGYRFSMWLRRPPTRLYWFRGWQVFLTPGRLWKNLGHLCEIFLSNFVLQRFIERRSHIRWTAHWFLAWGCLMAGAITFPLSFGWIHFETGRSSQDVYRAFLFGIPVGQFPVHSVIAEIAFNALDIAAVMVLIGVFSALWRRGRDHGAMAVQQFADDLMPLILLFAICVTGLFLTASTHLMNGLHYTFLSQLHAITVIITLVYLPFGKFFHVFQRPAQLGVDFYKRAGKEGEQAVCIRCELPYGSRMQMDDLKRVQEALHIHYQLPDGTHYQDVCPKCRRKNLALLQDNMWKSTRIESEST